MAVTICGKCGLQQTPCACPPETAIAKPTTYETITALPGVQHPVIADLPAYTRAMTGAIRAGAKGDRSKWCPTCRAIGNTFGCAKCNGGPTRVSW